MVIIIIVFLCNKSKKFAKKLLFVFLIYHIYILGSCGELGVGKVITFAHDPIRISLPDGSSHVASIAAGFQISALIAAPRSLLYTFGSGAYYRLGHGNTDDCLIPTLVAALEYAGQTCPISGECTGISHVACGTWHMAAVGKFTTDIYSWYD